jgi:hypothetical protein
MTLEIVFCRLGASHHDSASIFQMMIDGSLKLVLDKNSERASVTSPEKQSSKRRRPTRRGDRPMIRDDGAQAKPRNPQSLPSVGFAEPSLQSADFLLRPECRRTRSEIHGTVRRPDSVGSSSAHTQNLHCLCADPVECGRLHVLKTNTCR